MAEPSGQPATRLAPATAKADTAPRAADAGPLFAAPERFGLFAALRLLEASNPDRPRFGEARRACDEPARLCQPPHLHFPPAAIDRIDVLQDGRPPRLYTFAFGLFGPQGPLPLHVSSEAQARRRSDRALADFCDVFHHRLIALYWRAHAKARPAIEQDRPDANRFRHRLGAVAGLAGPAHFDRSALPDRFALFTAGLIAMQTRPTEVISRLVGLFFGVPARLEEFAGAWVDVPLAARTRIGRMGNAHRLGVDAVEGGRVYLRHHRFRLVLGSLGLGDFTQFLPGGPAQARLEAMVHHAVGLEFDWDVQLVLRRDEVPGTALGRGTRLGWTSWIAARRRDRDADDVVLRGSGADQKKAGRR